MDQETKRLAPKVITFHNENIVVLVGFLAVVAVAFAGFWWGYYS